jgi:hypothetical protein
MLPTTIAITCQWRMNLGVCHGWNGYDAVKPAA